jgi:peptidoglycan/LPS O-acetylase OafA/YrhL
MLFHYTYSGPQHHVWHGSYPILSQIFKYGFLGVDVFFILSGFVILLTAYEKDAIAFTAARMVRLYPAYWICVTLTAICVVVIQSHHAPVTLRQYLVNLTMVQGFFGVPDVSGVYWTLAVEIQFYFLTFLVLLFGQVRRLSYLLGLWLLASIILSLQEPHGVVRFFLFPQWSSYFIAGAMLFLIHREGPSPYKIFVVVGCYVLSVAYAVNLVPFGGDPLEADLSPAVIASALAVSYALFLFIAMRPRSSGGSNPFYILGLITYPLYLLHQDIGYIILRSAPPGVNRFLLLGGVMFAMIVLAWLVHIGPEKWLASRLKSALSRPQDLAVAIKSLVSKWLAESDVKPAIADPLVPATIPVPVSPVLLSPQPLQSPQAASSGEIHVSDT